MKKIITAMVMAAGLGAAFTASAAGIVIKNGVAITNADTECPLLGDNVTINLSNNVSGAYSCDLALAEIKVATCHKAGSRKASQIACQQVSQDETGNPIYNDASCDGTTGQTFEIADFRAFAGSSKGGSVGAKALGGACTDSQVSALNHFN